MLLGGGEFVKIKFRKDSLLLQNPPPAWQKSFTKEVFDRAENGCIAFEKKFCLVGRWRMLQSKRLGVGETLVKQTKLCTKCSKC